MNFAEVRYRYDEPGQHGIPEARNVIAPDTMRARSRLLAESVKITPSLFPGLGERLDDLGAAMMLHEPLDCFVYPDALMQASCMAHQSGSKQSFSVLLSSGLVERLTPDEIRFVIGHEVGHFICHHWKYPSEHDKGGLGMKVAVLRLLRAAEISADRIGMLACRSLEDACGAMIKVAAGLGAPHLRPDIPSLLKQFRELTKQKGIKEGIWTTHPVIPLRIRALVRFEPIFRSILAGQPADPALLGEIDERIEADFDRSTGHALREISDRSLESVRIWGLVFLFSADGVISKAEQELLRETLGEKRSGKILRFLGSQQGSPREAVERKLTDACAEAQAASLADRTSLVFEFDQLLRDAGILDDSIEDAFQWIRNALMI